MESFDTKKYKIDKPCVLKHIYKDTDFNLYYRTRGNPCVQCAKLKQENSIGFKKMHTQAIVKARKPLSAELRKKHCRTYYKKNKQIILAKQRKYLKENLEHCREVGRKSYSVHRIDYNTQKRIKTVKDCLLLKDSYIKKAIYNKTDIKAEEITPRMVGIKRAQLTLTRGIKELKHELNRRSA